MCVSPRNRQHLWHLGVDGLEKPFDPTVGDTTTAMPPTRNTPVTTTDVTGSPVHNGTAPATTTTSTTTPTPLAVPPDTYTNYSAVNSFIGVTAIGNAPSADVDSTTATATAAGNISDIGHPPQNSSARIAIDTAIRQQHHLHKRNATPTPVPSTKPPSSSSPPRTHYTQPQRHGSRIGTTIARPWRRLKGAAPLSASYTSSGSSGGVGGANGPVGTKISVVVHNITLLSAPAQATQPATTMKTSIADAAAAETPNG